jgi:inner membrane transporter RhtA
VRADRGKAGGSRLAGAVIRAPAPALFIAAAVSQYAGAALAVALFEALPAASVAWARVATAAAVLLGWRRPWRQRWSQPRLALTTAFGLALAAMNVSFYLAIERLPLGTAVAIEFSGPVTVAAAGARRWRDAAVLGLALAGVLLLAEVSWTGSPTGVIFALAAAFFWGCYIVLAARVARAGDGVGSLAAGMAIGAAAFAPALAPGAVPALFDPVLLLLCAGVGVLSSTIPYVLEQVALRRLRRSQFALLQSLLPATAAAVGLVLLRQVPSAGEVSGILLVATAVAVRSRD